MRRLSISSVPCFASKRQPVAVLMSGIGNGHASLPTVMIALSPVVSTLFASSYAAVKRSPLARSATLSPE